MKKDNKRNGFTLVELLVVIAILAVLASVSIVGYLSFVGKARRSNDETVITQMNIGLQADRVGEGDFTYAGEAIQALYLQGWNDGKMKPYSTNYEYAYSLEQNKMYLIDDNDNVVFPDTAVDKSTLWGFYYNAVEGGISGVTKYIAMENINNEDNFSKLVGATNDYKIDLNGYSINLSGEYNETSIYNGWLVNGIFKNKDTYSEDNVKIGEAITASDITDGGTYVNKVWESATFDGYSSIKNVTFKNCVFYDPRLSFMDASFTFENCSFVGSGTDGSKKNTAIKYAGYTNTSGSGIIKNCTFTNTDRGISLEWEDSKVAASNIQNINFTIEGCTFNGIKNEKFAAVQIVNKEFNITFKNNTINALGSAQTIIRFHSNYNGFSDNSNLDKITFEGNKVKSSISEDKYIDLDDGKKVIDDVANSSAFYQAAFNKFKASVTKI